jgi:ribosome-associated translation inhibitor RaiA
MNGTAVVSEEQQKVPDNISNYINSHIERLIKPHFETFENEDIKPNMLSLIHELQDSVDNAVKKTGDIISGSLHILKVPQAKMDAVNKEYVDWLFLTLSEKLETKLSKNSDVNLNHFKIKNIQSPIDLNDAATKNYVDQKFESMSGYLNQNLHHLFSKGQILMASVKKTFFFNPGFICPQKIHIVSVGFSTSPYKYKIGEKLKYGEKNPTKLYFMVNNEIRSEYIIEKDVQLGHILKEFDDPIIFEKGDNFMMVVETMIEDASVNISFY